MNFSFTENTWSKFAKNINAHYHTNGISSEVQLQSNGWTFLWSHTTERSSRNLLQKYDYFIDVSGYYFEPIDLSFFVGKKGDSAKQFPKSWVSNELLLTESKKFNDKFYLKGNPPKLARELFSSSRVEKNLFDIQTFHSLYTYQPTKYGFYFNLRLENFTPSRDFEFFILYLSHNLMTVLATHIKKFAPLF
jgi:hypothetical protein